MGGIDIVGKLPLRELLDFAGDLLARGDDFDSVVDQLAALADALVDWRDIVPGPAGEFIEARDRAAYRSAFRVLVRFAERHLR